MYLCVHLDSKAGAQSILSMRQLRRHTPLDYCQTSDCVSMTKEQTQVVMCYTEVKE